MDETRTLEVRGLHKRYGDRQVLQDVSFRMRPGRLTGFVGGNGAGKTTTMRCILGVVRPDAGECLVGGRPLAAADRSRFGYMPEERGLYPKMGVAEQIRYFGELHGLDRATATANTERLLAELGLAERARDKVQALSLGNQQRAQIAVALVHEPELLMLDEPFSGLDPEAVEVVLGVLRGYADRGAPVLFSSHQLDVVERLSDDLVVISDGRIRLAGDRAELQAAHSRGLYRLEVPQDAGWLRELPGIEVVEFDRGAALFRAPGEQEAQRVLRAALDRGPVTAFGPHTVRLASIFQEVR